MATEDKLREYLKRATVDLTDARRRLGELEEERHEPIAIIGMSCRYPGAPTVEDYWSLLTEGRSGVVEVPAARWNIDDYYTEDRRVAGGVYTRHGAFLPDIAGWDAEFFGIPPAEALRMDPQQRLLMELVCEGLDNAGTSAQQLAGSRTAVLVGLMDTAQYGRLQVERYGAEVIADPYFGQGVTASVLAGRLAYQFDLRGPAITLDTACSSSLVGVHLAAQALRGGECDLAVAAGAFLIMHPDTYVQSCATSMLAPDGRCKTFDSSADGYVMGEGGGLVVLERLSDAQRNNRRIRAVLRGSAVNQDGRSNGLSAPSRSAQAEVIRRALADARVAPEEVGYVEAHGSGTQLGDAIELSALHDVFGGRRPAEQPLRVGAVKTNIGHTQSAAGVAGLIKTVLLLEHGVATGNLNTTEPSSAIPADGTISPVLEPTPLPGDRPIAGVSGFGWSGTNGHLVLQAAENTLSNTDVPASCASTSGQRYLLPVSAASGPALAAQLDQLGRWLADRPELSLADVAHTLSTGRSAYEYRRALLCADTADAARQLAGAAGSPGVQATSRPRVAFLLPGVGDQYAGLGRELYRTEPVYAAAIDECVGIVEQRCGLDLRPLLFPTGQDAADNSAADNSAADNSAADNSAADNSFAALVGRATPAAEDPVAAATEELLEQAEFSHPFQFAVEYALARLLADRGVSPDVLVGYSLGEYVAACLAGVFSLSDALYLVVERARIIAGVPAGRMLAVAADADAVTSAISASGAEIDIAAFNGPAMTVVSGLAPDVETLAGTLGQQGIACRPLRTVHAFHSWLLEPARDKLAALLSTVEHNAPRIPIISNRTGQPLTAEQAGSVEHWADHLVKPVRFAQSVQHCIEAEVDVFVELGAGQTLGGLVRQNLPGSCGAGVLGTLPARWQAGRSSAEVAAVASCRGQLWEHGVQLDWAAEQPAGRVVTLPSYPFQRRRFWPDVEPGQAPAGRPASRSAAAEPAEYCYAPVWRQLPAGAPGRPLALAGPLVIIAGTASGPGSVAAELAELAAAGGTEVLEVVAGPAAMPTRRDGRRIVIDPAEAGHYAEALSRLPGTGPVHLVHLGSLAAGSAHAEYADEDELRAAITAGFDSVLRCIQALGELPGSRGVRLLTVSRGACEVLGGDLPAPYRALGHGLGRVAQHEYAGLSWHGTDLDPDAAQPAVEAGQLARELLAETPEPAVTGWRRGRRWQPDWAPVDTGQAASTEPTSTEPASTQLASTEPAWREDGVYLITGGTRGLGLALARRLVAAGVGKLALVSRNATSSDAGVQAAGVRAAIAELRSAGAEILLLAADVAKPAELRAAVTACRQRFGALHGVLHAAGAPASGMLQRQTVEQGHAVLGPKVLAMSALAELVSPATPAELRPELLVLYSSAITTFGGIGEGDYCAANTVLDSYGAALAASAPSTRVLTVAWGPWQHDDWQVPTAGGLAERARAYRRRYGFTDEGGCEFLERMLAVAGGSVVAVRQSMAEARQEWSAVLDLASLTATAAPPSGERFPRPQLRTEFVAPRSELEQLIAEVWQSYLGIDGVGVHDAFFELGGNSLVGMSMVHAVESRLDTTIAPAVLFEHPTIAEFAAALEHTDAAGADSGLTDLLTTSSDRGQRRRRARSGVRK
ncbi:MAG: SDR family NAD(P)-dependent oxidoreductase [Jatrophihabitantaceae bacterium]